MMNIFFDGTWNTPRNHTNIHRLYKTYKGKYFKGPGTGAFFLERILGGAFGFGTDAIVDEAHAFVVKHYRRGELNIFGFSRGAAAARMLAARICSKGGKVDFLGCLDTVSAFGIPLGFWPFTTYDDLFTDMHVHPGVIRAAHAQALDEHRLSLIGTPMEPREGIVQQGFRGNHSYVGSSGETLKWMIGQFEG